MKKKIIYNNNLKKFKNKKMEKKTMQWENNNL